jgi:hypothetical protein
MSFIVAGVAAAGVVGGLVSSLSGGKKRRAEQRSAGKAFDKQMKSYESFDIKNTYSGIGNPGSSLTNFASDLSNPGAELTNFASGMQNTAVGATNFASQMENTAEDLTVNTQQADMVARQQQQGLSNTLGSLKGAAGSSGIAALAQTLAGQQSQNLQSASASIGQQESANTAMAAQQGANIQQAIAGESSMNQQMEINQGSQNQIMSAQMASGNQQFGASMGNQNAILAAQMGQNNQQFGATMDFEGQMARAGGAQNQQQMQFDKQGNMLAMAGERKGAADAARAQARQGVTDTFGSLTGAAGAFSDRRLKKNIKFVGKSKKGFKIYTFEYKNKEYGEGTYQGVMSDEIPSKFVIKKNNGFDFVDYSNLDVQFKKI